MRRNRRPKHSQTRAINVSSESDLILEDTAAHTDSHDMSDEKALSHSLLDPAAWPHPVAEVRVIETHISWVFLTGEYAYKIKKPLTLSFLDFSTLDLRHRWCEEELRLNSRWAPQLYIDVVPIAGSAGRPKVG